MRQTVPARFPPPLVPGTRRPGAPGAATGSGRNDDHSRRRPPTTPPTKGGRLRRPASFLFGGLLIFFGVMTYALVISHHVNLPHWNLPSLGSKSVEFLHLLSGTSDARLHADAPPLKADLSTDMGSKQASKEAEARVELAEDTAALKKQVVADQDATQKAAAEEAAAVKAAAEKAAAQKAAAEEAAAENAAAEKAAAEEAAAEKAVAEKAAAEKAAAEKAVMESAAERVAKDKAAAEKAAAEKAAAEKAAAEKIAAEKAAAEKAEAERQAAMEQRAAQRAAEKKAAEEKAAAEKAEAERKAAEVEQQRAAAEKAVADAAAASKAQKAGCPELTRELVSRRAKQNTIMLTATDWKIYETMGVSWMKHLAHLGVDYYLVAATDQRTAEFLAETNHHGSGEPPCFNFIEPGTVTNTQEYKYGDEHYKAATWRKVTVVEKIVDWGFNVLHSDVDVVWFRDPLPYFLGPAMEHADIAVSTDLISTGNRDGDDGLEVNIHQHVNCNTGVYFVKSNEGGRRFMADWVDKKATMGHENDQVGLYAYLRRQYVHIDQAKRRMSLHNSTVHVGLLSAAMLLNGYSYFIPKLHEHNHQALAVHFTWVPLSREGKFQRMRDGMMYHDTPDYYSEPLYVAADISYTPAPVDYNDWKDTEAMIKFHLAAMEGQLRQLYRVMAIAAVLNRTLIIPRLKCYCYKNWFMMEQCRIPGDHVTHFPMDCNLDQFLRPKVLTNWGPKMLSTERLEPWPFTFREYTLMQNPRFPQRLRQGQVVVQPYPPGVTPACPTCILEKSMPDPLTDGPTLSMTEPNNISEPASRRFVFIPANLTEVPFREALSKYANAKVIRFRNLTDVFGGITDRVLSRVFNKFVDAVTSNWCCRDVPFVQQGLKLKERLTIQW